MDNLTYGYNITAGKLVNNRLRHVKDAIGDANYTEDIDNQADDNYSYDAIGNLTKDTREGITNISWSVYGKILTVTKGAGTITYTYDASGNRISKSFNGKTTWYVRDASGNVMAVYEQSATINSGHLTEAEVHLYGSSRLGIYNIGKDMVSPPTGEISIFERGKKFFELANHLGNVLVTVSDRKIGVSGNGAAIDNYVADIITATDYAPFGMCLVGKKFNSEKYVNGFNGKRKDNDIYGDGNAYDFEARIQDPRLGKWFSVDPVQNKYPAWSPYNYTMNSPLKLKDNNGEDVVVTITGNAITFSSTIYITGPGAKDVANNANKSFTDFSKAALQNRTYTDAAGKVYEVQIKMNFVGVVSDTNDPAYDANDPNLAALNAVKSEKAGTSGNNIINLTSNKNYLIDDYRANANLAAGENYRTKEEVREEFESAPGIISMRRVTKFGNEIGNMAYLNQGKSSEENGVTAIHETFHNFGLGDRYIENVLYSLETKLPDKTINSTASIDSYYPGFENDMMRNNKFEFNQIHIDNMAGKALELSKLKGSSFVMFQAVDNASRFDKASAIKSFKDGKTTYNKVEEIPAKKAF